MLSLTVLCRIVQKQNPEVRDPILLLGWKGRKWKNGRNGRKGRKEYRDSRWEWHE